MRVHGVRLELDEKETSVEVGFNGFASARGMKRNISGEDRAWVIGLFAAGTLGYGTVQELIISSRSASPTKPSAGGMAYPQIQRTGPRKALGEIHLAPEPQQDDWGGKRQRAG